VRNDLSAAAGPEPAGDLEHMSLQALIDLRDQVARVLKARFEKSLALIFTDVVGSTTYVAVHCDVAGRELLQRHHDLLARALAESSGRVVDTAGDGAFCVAPSVSDGARILTRFQQLVLEDNGALSRTNRLEVRSGLHYGPVLVDERQVSGEAVHLAARVMGTAGGSEIRLSEQAFGELPVVLRPRCRRLPPQALKGIPDPVEMYALDWRDSARFPAALEIVEAHKVEFIPLKARVGIGRLADYEGRIANDIVLTHPDPALVQRISRWHAELEMTSGGYLLRAISRSPTDVDGRRLAEGEAVHIGPGSVVRLADVLTLKFLGSPSAGDRTVEVGVPP
jgi:class 3 adenylate cyclase